MTRARRQHRAIPQSRKATFDRGMALVYAALYSTEPLPPERLAAIRHELEATPYRKRQGELTLPEAAGAT